MSHQASFYLLQIILEADSVDANQKKLREIFCFCHFSPFRSTAQVAYEHDFWLQNQV